MSTRQPVDSERGMTETGANVVSYSRFREIQDRRRAISATEQPTDHQPTTDAYVVHVAAIAASLRPLNRKPC
jgi:hypothetical protein